MLGPAISNLQVNKRLDTQRAVLAAGLHLPGPGPDPGPPHHSLSTGVAGPASHHVTDCQQNTVARRGQHSRSQDTASSRTLLAALAGGRSGVEGGGEAQHNAGLSRFTRNEGRPRLSCATLCYATLRCGRRTERHCHGSRAGSGSHSDSYTLQWSGLGPLRSSPLRAARLSWPPASPTTPHRHHQRRANPHRAPHRAGSTLTIASLTHPYRAMRA